MRQMSWPSTMVLVALSTISLSCSLLQRSSTSGYSSWNETGSDQSPEVSTFQRRQPAPNPRRGTEYELQTLERRISTESEFDEYDRVRSNLSEKNRVQYLKQKDKNSRGRYLASVGVSESMAFDSNITSAIESSDIVIGMPKEAVIKSWGEPENIEVAGNPNYGNERWLYTHFESSTEGFQKQERVVYFERGRVTGWETR